MKTIILGDTHGRRLWKSLANGSDYDELVFIGDYFDTHDNVSFKQQISNFKEIIRFKKTTDKKVVLLIGNHDHHYFPEIGYTGTSGYQPAAAEAISQVLDKNRRHLQMAFQVGNYLCTHAGVSQTWLKKNDWKGQNVEEFVNSIWKDNPKAFKFTGFKDPTGDEPCQTPIWIRPNSLINDAVDGGHIVGHTQMDKITGYQDRFWFVDVLGTSRQYLQITDGLVSVCELQDSE